MPNMLDEAAGVLTPEQIELLTARLDALPRPTFRDELVRAETQARHVGLQALVDAPPGPTGVRDHATEVFWRNRRDYGGAPVVFSEEAKELLDAGMREAFNRCAVEPRAPRRITATEAASQVRMPGLTLAQVTAASYPAVLDSIRADMHRAQETFYREMTRPAPDPPMAERVQRLIDRALNRETVKVGDGISTAMHERMKVGDAQTVQLRFCPSRMILERRDGTSRPTSGGSDSLERSYVTSAPVLVNMQTDNPRRLGVVRSVDSAPAPVRNGTVGSRLRTAAQRLRRRTDDDV